MEVVINIFLLISFILLKCLLVISEVNSGISKLLKDDINTLGNIITGITIPEINPYLETAIEYVKPNFCKLRGIINCLMVDNP